MKNPTSNASHGVRQLTLEDQAPDCEILINRQLYDLAEIAKNKLVVDIGCGFGRFKSIVENAGGTWHGVEPFEGGFNTHVGDAENLPFPDQTYDIAIMHAVLEHVPSVESAFKEVGRVLKPGGLFVGYVAFMECFHEISYNHLSFKSLEYYANRYGMKLEKVSGGRRFGLDYHKAVLYYPLPYKWFRGFTAWRVRSIIFFKSRLAYLGLRTARKMTHEAASQKSSLYYKVECLRLSQGFDFIIRKLG
ncbi:MAG: class I SAM-dependent methyltransferase [Flavobacteriales bacterium]|nr:class I SAM-dependent methyltransferase [Flavobacteriales bacterium]